ncbi:hypothetical protein RM96_03770 [Cupriavidus sp. IDO]|nr:hypothetical protein RM96_03770 [Cupriavidus sp. IDO]
MPIIYRAHCAVIGRRTDGKHVARGHPAGLHTDVVRQQFELERVGHQTVEILVPLATAATPGATLRHCQLTCRSGLWQSARYWRIAIRRQQPSITPCGTPTERRVHTFRIVRSGLCALGTATAFAPEGGRGRGAMSGACVAPLEVFAAACEQLNQIIAIAE